jgi:hypothetical protein
MTLEGSNEMEFSAERALSVLGALPVPIEDAAKLDARRGRLVPNLGQFAADTFARRTRRSLVRLRVLLAAAVAAAVLAGIGVGAWQARRDLPARSMAALRATDGDVRVEREGRAIDIGSGSATPFELGVRDRLQTNDGHAEVSLVSGAKIELAPRSELGLYALNGGVDRVDERVVLVGGKIDVHVPKLGPKGRLSVGTPDATVTVHGTAFSVEVRTEGSSGPVTTVSVTEGLVSVKTDGHEIFLGPGATWSSLPPAADAAPVRAADSSPDAAAAGSAKVPAERHSTLNEENALFRAALDARRAGHPGRAVEIVDRLTARYPTSPLLPAAKAERARALSDLAHPPAPEPE